METNKGEKMKNQDYEFARNSKYSNLGDDVKCSARHIRNESITLSEIKEGLISEDLLKRDSLMKLNPIELSDNNKDNYKLNLTAYLCLRGYPSKPKYSKHSSDEQIIKVNEFYFNTYISIKEYLEATAKDIDCNDLILGLKKHVSNLIKEVRQNHGIPYSCGNILVSYHNSVLSNYAYSRNSVRSKLNDFNELDDDGGNIEAVSKIITGKTINQVFGVKSDKKKNETFSRASIYTKNSKRIGPNSGRFGNDNECIEFLMKGLGLKAVQWGNSVPDSERKDHLRSLSFALYDLKRITGLDSKNITFDKLSMAIGARGKHGALAHFEPSLNVINLTRKNGFGSLAHEWGHFFDRTLGGNEYLSEIYLQGDDLKPYEKIMIKIQMEMEIIKSRFKNVKDFRKFSSKKRAYWLSGREVFARAFEKWCHYELNKNKELNNYLAGLESYYLWPNNEEVKRLAPIFNEFFKLVREDLK